MTDIFSWKQKVKKKMGWNEKIDTLLGEQSLHDDILIGDITDHFHNLTFLYRKSIIINHFQSNMWMYHALDAMNYGTEVVGGVNQSLFWVMLVWAIVDFALDLALINTKKALLEKGMIGNVPPGTVCVLKFW